MRSAAATSAIGLGPVTGQGHSRFDRSVMVAAVPGSPWRVWMSSMAPRASEVAHSVATLTTSPTFLPAGVPVPSTLDRSKISLLVNEQAVWSSRIIDGVSARSEEVSDPFFSSW